MSVEVCIRAF